MSTEKARDIAFGFPDTYISLSSNDTLDGTLCVHTLPFMCTYFTVQRIVGRKSMSVSTAEKSQFHAGLCPLTPNRQTGYKCTEIPITQSGYDTYYIMRTHGKYGGRRRLDRLYKNMSNPPKKQKIPMALCCHRDFHCQICSLIYLVSKLCLDKLAVETSNV